MAWFSTMILAASESVWSWILGLLMGSICFAPPVLLLIVMVQAVRRRPPRPGEAGSYGFPIVPGSVEKKSDSTE